MKSDQNETSTCPAGEERYEEFVSKASGKTLVQYDHRTPEGVLFSCVAETLTACRQKYADWLLFNTIKGEDPKALEESVETPAKIDLTISQCATLIRVGIVTLDMCGSVRRAIREYADDAHWSLSETDEIRVMGMIRNEWNHEKAQARRECRS